MSPANQRLGTAQAAIDQMNLRLIEQLEFISLCGKRQFGLKRQPGFQLSPDRGFEQHIAAPPGRLGATERKMAVAQEFVRDSAAVRIAGCADADPDAMLTRSSLQRRVERQSNTLRQLRH